MPTFDEIVTTTIENRSGIVADGVSESRALLAAMKGKGNLKKTSGGQKLRRELSHSANGTASFYSGFETLSVAQSNVLGYADFDWKQASAQVVMSGLEYEIQNAGAEAKLDLAAERIKVAEDSIKNLISAGCYSDGTGYSGKQIGGLQLLVADTPTSGTVGGIDRSSNTFWRNQYYSGVTDGGAAVSSSNINKYMTTVFTRCTRGADRPDLIAADNNYWISYHEYLSSISRIVDEKSGGMAGLGFPTLKFMGADVVLDGGYGGDSPANHMYFLNTKYLFLETHPKRNFVLLKGDRQPVNQDGLVKVIAWAGNMTMNNAFLQGVLKA